MDDFTNRNPFFVAGVTFIWLVVIPLIQAYLRKYKFISAIDAFRKLRDDPSAQLLDIRDGKSVAFLATPSLKILNKAPVQINYSEADEDGFVKKVLESFSDPSNTVLCIMDKKYKKSFFPQPCTFTRRRRRRKGKGLKRMEMAQLLNQLKIKLVYQLQTQIFK